MFGKSGKEVAINSKIPVGVSECLLGEPVRYNGSHKHSRLCTKELTHIFDFKPTCPEVASGLGVPREPIRLINMNEGIKVRGAGNHDIDVTDELQHQAAHYLDTHNNICGFIFTPKSPSCGLFNVKVYHQNGHPLDKGQGMFAKSIVKQMPYLPVEELGRLNDPLLKETFISAVFVYHDWSQSVAQKNDKKSLIDFHSRHKFQLMAHCINTYKTLGQLVSDLKTKPLHKLKWQYLNQFMAAIKKPTTRRRHCNVMEHAQGYLRNTISVAERQSINKTIHDYRKGFVPLVVPITLITHYAKLHRTKSHYLLQQSYLNPYPLEMGLRNGI